MTDAYFIAAIVLFSFDHFLGGLMCLAIGVASCVLAWRER
jgi:hypothetical protein